MATVNVGASGSVSVSVDTGGNPLPLTVLVCRTNPATGACLSPPAPSVTVQIDAGATPTFGIFVTGGGTVPFAPGSNRIFVRFASGGVTRGSTGIAVRTGGAVLLIAAPRLPDATVGVPYLFSFCMPQPTNVNDLCNGGGTPTGGQPPYHFQLDTGGGFQPFGLTLELNGLLDGTPTVAGARTFCPCAVDLAGDQSCSTVTLRVNSADETFIGGFAGTFGGTFSTPICTFGGTHSGTLTLVLRQAANGTVAGTATADAGTGVFVISGTSCSTEPRTVTAQGTASGSTTSLTASLSETTPEPGRMTLAFTGTRSGNSISGTLTVTNEFRGFTNGVQVSATRLSSTVPMTLTKQ